MRFGLKVRFVGSSGPFDSRLRMRVAVLGASQSERTVLLIESLTLANNIHIGEGNCRTCVHQEMDRVSFSLSVFITLIIVSISRCDL
jgi:hypothetical protein